MKHELIEIRTENYNPDENGLEICEHIFLSNAYEDDDQYECEYVEFLKVKCAICNKVYELAIKVN
jgi:hypothetical protein